MTPSRAAAHPAARSPRVDRKLATIIVLPILVAATFFELYAVWGVLFLYWSAASLRDGEAFLVERIQRGRHPILFWIITALWVAFGVLYLVADLTARL